jgi:hypothetical protein
VSPQIGLRTISYTHVLSDGTIDVARVTRVADGGAIGEMPPAMEVHGKSNILPCPGDVPTEMAVAHTPVSLGKMLRTGASAFTRSVWELNPDNFSAFLTRGRSFGGNPKQLDSQNRGSEINGEGRSETPRQEIAERTEKAGFAANTSLGVTASREINSDDASHFSGGENPEWYAMGENPKVQTSAAVLDTPNITLVNTQNERIGETGSYGRGQGVYTTDLSPLSQNALLCAPEIMTTHTLHGTLRASSTSATGGMSEHVPSRAIVSVPRVMDRPSHDQTDLLHIPLIPLNSLLCAPGPLTTQTLHGVFPEEASVAVGMSEQVPLRAVGDGITRGWFTSGRMQLQC